METFRALQLTQLQILKELDRICKKNSITYYLAWGSLLGAVRHQGFIPWDDDIDVCMSIEDMFRFEKACKRDLGEEFYYLSRTQNKYNYIFWHRIGLKGTTCNEREFLDLPADNGICIDIFPLFSLPDDQTQWPAYNQLMKRYQLLSEKYLHVHTIKRESSLVGKCKKMVHALLPDWTNRYYSQKILSKLIARQGKSKAYFADYSDGQPPTVLSGEIFRETVQLPFEGMSFPAPIGYDEYLKAVYGEYMSPPPLTDRANHCERANVVLDFHKPYREFWAK